MLDHCVAINTTLMMKIPLIFKNENLEKLFGGEY